MLPIEKIEISDNDIDWVESIMDGISFDKTRRDVIKNLDSLDIQAFPGTGKTTVLVAKLAILANKWPYSHRGICVLSHTNVAREEIEERLGKTDVGRKLLSYPHFVGTVHSFFNTYISMPWLKSTGVSINIIDSEIVLEKRNKKLSYGTKAYLERKKFKYPCEAVEIPIKIDIGCGEQAQSYKDVLKAVTDSHNAGEFTFQEMLLYAKHILIADKSISNSVVNRFPLLFIDEAQDTNLVQWELIELAFSSAKEKLYNIRQGFGDCNQAIFSSYNTSYTTEKFFPREGNLTINDSKRFNNYIANMADNLSVYQNGMVGNAANFDHIENNKVIFAFEKENITEVLTAYAKCILENFTDDELIANHKLGVHAVGMVHTGESVNDTDKKFPSGIFDYHSSYVSNYSRKKDNPQSLIEYFRYGKYFLNETGELSALIDYYSKGIIRVIEYFKKESINRTSTTFVTLCSLIKNNETLEFRSDFLELCNMKLDSREEWRLIGKKITQILHKFFDVKLFEWNFLKWNNNTLSLTETENFSGPNVYHYLDDETSREVELKLGSIHSVKGRTHLATLVVETYWHDHNIKSILPWFYDAPTAEIKQRNKSRLKCHYVALTRAKGLVAMALPKDSFDDNVEKLLKEKRWKVIVV